MVHLWLHGMEYVTFVDIIWIHGAWFNENIYEICFPFRKRYAVSMKLNVW